MVELDEISLLIFSFLFWQHVSATAFWTFCFAALCPSTLYMYVHYVCHLPKELVWDLYTVYILNCAQRLFSSQFRYSLFIFKRKGPPKKCNICFCRNLLRKLIFHSNFQLLLCVLAVCRVPGDSIRPSLFKTYSEKRLKYLSTYFFVVYKPLKVGRWVCVVT